MIGLLPIGRIITFIAVAYSIVTGMILWAVYDNQMGFAKAISVASGGSAVLHLILLGLFHFGWRWLWGKFPALNKWLFPNLNGTWRMVIHWNWEGKSGTSCAKAIIKQDFLKIGMDVDAEDSDSETLLAKPKRDPETGRGVYIMYFSPRRNINQEPPHRHHIKVRQF